MSTSVVLAIIYFSINDETSELHQIQGDIACMARYDKYYLYKLPDVIIRNESDQFIIL